MSRQPPPPPFFPEAFANTRSTNTRQNVTGDSAYVQGGPGPGHVHPPRMPSPTSYPSQQYSSSQPSSTPSRRSTLATTPAYDHASLSSHPPAPPPLSGSTSYNPSFPVPVRHPPTNPSGPPPSAPSSTLHRAATLPMPVPLNTASSAPYDMRPPNTTHTPSQPGNLGGPQPAQGWSYLEVHERDGDSSNFRDENLEQNREGARHSGEYMRDRSPPNRSSAGRQQGGHGGSSRRTRPPEPELLRCICGKVITRAEVEYRRSYCPRGHMGQWQRV